MRRWNDTIWFGMLVLLKRYSFSQFILNYIGCVINSIWAEEYHTSFSKWYVSCAWRNLQHNTHQNIVTYVCICYTMGGEKMQCESVATISRCKRVPQDQVGPLGNMGKCYRRRGHQGAPQNWENKIYLQYNYIKTKFYYSCLTYFQK